MYQVQIISGETIVYSETFKTEKQAQQDAKDQQDLVNSDKMFLGCQVVILNNLNGDRLFFHQLS